MGRILQVASRVLQKRAVCGPATGAHRIGREERAVMMLGTEAFARARRFVETKARPLEVARMRFHFDSAPEDALVAELTKFQNDDGGFGNALEPDLRAHESSALATSIAFQLIRETGRTLFESTASSAVDYLRKCGLLAGPGVINFPTSGRRQDWIWLEYSQLTGSSPFRGMEESKARLTSGATGRGFRRSARLSWPQR